MLHRLKSFFFLFFFLFPFALHLWNIGHDLPNLYSFDEPHHLNIAAHFGTGDFKPHDFKYPTLWPTALAFLFGSLYAGSFALGLVRSTADFAHQFLYSPTVFYLSARILSSFFVAAIPALFYYIGRTFYSKDFAVCAALLAATCPSLLDLGIEATPYGLEFFLICCALVPYHRIGRGGGRKAYAWAGFLIGLATSAQYTAAPLVLLLLVATDSNPFRKRWGGWIAGLGAALIGFLLGTPFFLQDLDRALGDVFSSGQLQIDQISGGLAQYRLRATKEIALNGIQYMDPWGLGGLLALVALFFERGKIRQGLWRWFVPFAVLWPLLTYYNGVSFRYLFAGVLPLIIPSTLGFLRVWKMDRRRTLGGALALLMGILFLSHYVSFRRELSLPDTRTLAKEWILQNVRPESRLFLSGAFECPQLVMAKAQVARLLEKTSTVHHPREAYYRLLLSGHPGGGYDLTYLRRPNAEVTDLPRRTELHYEAYDTLAPQDEGMGSLRKKGIAYAVVDRNLENLPQHKNWISDLRRNLQLAARFSPSPGQIKCPDLEIYRDPAAARVR